MKYLSEVYGKGGIYAKCVCASVANGVPIYTLETKAPKFIDAEFEKHRMLSSNSSSSRAIPFKGLDDIYIPFDIRKNQKGMQGYKEITGEHKEYVTFYLQRLYRIVFDDLKQTVETFDVHKQHLNRYLEPFMFQKKVVTATEWDNFFKLRLAPDAQPEIQELARCMKEAINKVEPTELSPGQWHLPYVNRDDEWDYIEDYNLYGKQCSAARCARVSYLNMDNSSPSIEKDLALYDRLLSSGHLTPFEHQASPMKNINMSNGCIESKIPKGVTHMDFNNYDFWSGNFRSWLQYRQLVSNWNG